MATLTIRDLDEAVKAALRVQAAQHGRSMEAEARAILSAAVAPSAPPAGALGSRIHALFRGTHADELELPDRSEPARAADFSP